MEIERKYLIPEIPNRQENWNKAISVPLRLYASEKIMINTNSLTNLPVLWFARNIIFR